MNEPGMNHLGMNRLRYIFNPSAFPPVVIFSLVGFIVMGYHPGAEDDGVYLAAVKARLNPALYPHDAPFFQLQMRASLFDNWMAAFVRATHIPLGWAELFFQFLSIAGMVWACWMILSRLFKENAARWGGVALFSAMLTLPVAGTALYIADQYLHPRNLATALILIAIAGIMAARPWLAVPLLALACVLHPMMGAYGISFCSILALTLSSRVRRQVRNVNSRLGPQAANVAPVIVFIPFAWLFRQPPQSWIDIMSTRHFLWLYKWTWYEWLGAIGPLILFWLVARTARRRGDIPLARFAIAVLTYGILQQAFAMIILAPESLIALSTFEPMRYLHLVYVFMTLIGGAYLGGCVLRAHAFRWFAFLFAAFGGMFLVQRHLFAATEHIELPDRPSANPWLQAFKWIRANTPKDAYFAVDPNYMAIPGEDHHSFRALAERSVLADNIKDASVLSKAPQLVPLWTAQVHALTGWNEFQSDDFERLRAQFGVNWVLFSDPPARGLDCTWHNAALAVCRIP